MEIIAGIPARMDSSRFPGKPLCNILGMPMIEHVYKRCVYSSLLTDIFIATCDKEIQEVINSFGGKVIMTEPNISRPGLRIIEACKQLNLSEDDIVVVVQGDEPLVNPEMINLAVEPLLKEKDIFVSNLATEITEEEWLDSNEIKIVTDLNMNAIYMSRSPIPSQEHEEERSIRLKQVCIMPFRWHFMQLFNSLDPTPLEKAESIEMLRAIQHGYKVRIVISPFETKSVDTEHDRQIAEKLMANDNLYKKYGRL